MPFRLTVLIKGGQPGVNLGSACSAPPLELVQLSRGVFFVHDLGAQGVAAQVGIENDV